MTAPAPQPTTTPAWSIRGHVIVGCNCDYGCPCNFNGLPTTGKCEGNWNWHVEDGSFGDVPLAGINFGLAVNWPGAIHEGNGEGILVIDERTDSRQRDAITALLSGRVGGPWKIIATTISRAHGPEFAPFEIEYRGYESSAKAGRFITVQMEPVRNKVTKVESFPRAILPQGFVFKEAELGASSAFRIDGPV